MHLNDSANAGGEGSVRRKDMLGFSLEDLGEREVEREGPIEGLIGNASPSLAGKHQDTSRTGAAATEVVEPDDLLPDIPLEHAPSQITSSPKHTSTEASTLEEGGRKGAPSCTKTHKEPDGNRTEKEDVAEGWVASAAAAITKKFGASF